LFSQAKQAVNNVATVSDVAHKLQDSEKLTFTAEYRLSDGSTATVVQQPPNAAFIGKEGRVILTVDSLYVCSTQSGKTTCQKNHNASGQIDSSNSGYIASAAGAGFIAAPVAFALLLGASTVPGAKVDKSERKIAGQNTTCLTISGLPAGNNTTGPDLKSFSACVTDNGLLASFEGAQTDGEKIALELTKLSMSADPSAFKPPADAEIIDVDQLKTPPN